MAPTAQPDLDEKGRQLAKPGQSSRFKGVTKVAGKFQANASIEGKQRHLGTFATEEEAADRVKECKANPELIKKAPDDKPSKEKSNTADKELPEESTKRRRLAKKTTPTEGEQDSQDKLPEEPTKRRRLEKKTSPIEDEPASKEKSAGDSSSPLGLLDQFRLTEVVTPQRQSTDVASVAPSSKPEVGSTVASSNPQKQTGLLAFMRPKAAPTNVQDPVLQKVDSSAPVQQAKAPAKVEQTLAPTTNQKATAPAKAPAKATAKSLAKTPAKAAPEPVKQSKESSSEKSVAKTPAKAAPEPVKQSKESGSKKLPAKGHQKEAGWEAALEGLNSLAYSGSFEDDADY